MESRKQQFLKPTSTSEQKVKKVRSIERPSTLDPQPSTLQTQPSTPHSLPTIQVQPRNPTQFLWSAALLLFILLTQISCLAPEKLMNFTEGPEFTETADSILNRTAIRVQPDDLLSIGVFNSNDVDPEVIAPFNLSFGGAVGADKERETTASAYRVNLDGTIDFPGLGSLAVAGQTLPEIRSLLIERLKAYLNDPIVHIRLTNFRVTVLGEVLSPGTYPLGEEEITILEALGLAGDLTPYGNRENILVIREENGTRTFGTVNLRDRAVFQSPYFYLRQNDVIYVEPLKEKSFTIATRAQQILPWVGASVGLVNLVFIILTRT